MEKKRDEFGRFKKTVDTESEEDIEFDINWLKLGTFLAKLILILIIFSPWIMAAKNADIITKSMDNLSNFIRTPPPKTDEDEHIHFKVPKSVLGTRDWGRYKAKGRDEGFVNLDSKVNMNSDDTHSGRSEPKPKEKKHEPGVFFDLLDGLKQVAVDNFGFGGNQARNNVNMEAIEE